MKNLRFSIMALALVFGSFIAAKAQTADDIIQKHIAAIGGLDNWKKVKTCKMVGSVNAQGTELPVTMTCVQNKAMRMEFSINGMNNYVILTSKGGWSYMPIQGQTKPEAMTADDVKQSQEQLDLQGPIVDYKQKGNKVTYLGKDEVEGTECYKLKIVYPSGVEETMFIDASNYYHIKSVQKTTSNGKEAEQVILYSNFQKLPEGIVFPMTVDQGMGAMTVKTVEINKPVDDNLFVPKS